MLRRRACSAPSPAGSQLAAGQHGPHHDLHLEHREARADAAAPAAAERDPGVGAGRLLEEALGAELVRVRVDRRVVMDEVGVRHQADARRVGPAADLERHLHEARLAVRQHRAGGAGSPGSSPSGSRRRRSRARPRARRARAGCGRAARSAQASDVAVVSWPATSIVSSSSRSSCEDIGEPSSWRASSSIVRTSSRSPGSARRSSISSNRSRSVSAWRRSNSANGPTRLSTFAGRPSGSGGMRLIGRSPKASISREPVAQSVEPGARVEPEHRPQDDLEREPLHPRLQRDLAVARPALHLALGHLRHQVAEARHPLAVEGREHQLALLHVGRLVEQDHRVLADERLEHARALARVEDVGRRREHLPDLVRPGEDHEPRGQREVHREAVPVTGAQPLQESERARPQAHALHERGEARSGRELLRGHGGALTGGYWAAIACAIAS